MNITMQIGDQEYPIETAHDVLDLIRKYIRAGTPYTINTYDTAEGAAIVIADVDVPADTKSTKDV